MDQNTIVIAALAVGTFAIRLGGYLLGASLPVSGGWARGLQALPGCLIVALLAMILTQSGPDEWLAAALALGVALLTQSLPLTMLAGVGAVWMLRMLL
jgi:uncharacterized membrane protein